MARRLAADLQLQITTAVLVGTGLVMVWSASSPLAHETQGSAYYFFLRQALWAAIGLAAMVAITRLDYRLLKQPKVVYGAAGITMACLVLVLFLPAVNGHHRWIRLGPLSFQPAELAKITTALYMAYFIDRKRQQINEFLPALLPALMFLGWFGFLIFIQSDLGSAAVVIFIGVSMLFLAGVKLRYFAALIGLGIPVLYEAIMMAAYRRDRIGAFLDPWSDARGSGYQIIQSLIAVGTGGITGVGLMEGRQKLFYLPYPFSDFVFAVIGEELGLIGAVLLVFGFLFFLWRGIRAAFRAPDPFAMFLAAGLSVAIVSQALINISVVLGLLPTKGIPLPFISAGGSSLLFTLVGVGLILNVSQHAD